MTSGVLFQPDAIEAIQNYENKDVNSCDVCGGKATVMTIEFRRFKLKEHGKDHLNLDIAASTPSFLASASNAALASLTSIADSAVREKLRHVDDEKADEQLECLVQACNARERQVLTSVVGALAKVQVSVKNGAETELQKAKDMPWQTGPLKRVAEDPSAL